MLTIKSFCFNAFQENTYILYNKDKEAIIVDPGCYTRIEQKILTSFIELHELTPTLLFNTHCHLDHVFGNNFVSEKYQLTALLHQQEQVVLDRLQEASTKWNIPCEAYKGPVKYVEQEDIIHFGEDQFKILFTPGHSPGSICFFNAQQDFIVSGDLIFKDGVGRTDLPGCDPNALIKSIQEQIFPLPETTTIYSGHGPSTTWGREKKANPYIQYLIKE